MADRSEPRIRFRPLFILHYSLFTIFCVGCAQTKTAAPQKNLKILSYNIEKGSAIDKIVEEIRAEDPDIALLQEVDQNTHRSGEIDQTAVLAQKLSMYSFYSPSYKDDGGTTGQAILSRYLIEETQIVTLPKSRNIAAAATVVVDDLRLRVFSVHFSSSVQDRVEYQDGAPLARRTEAEKIVSLVGQSGLPAIVGCDLNDVPKSKPHEVLTASLQDVGPAEKTWPSWAPDEQLDYVMISGTLSAQHPKRSEKLTSDHRMVSVEVLLPR
jgi:endonuclease/exonuclease/phosphatase family metal-dependent hydrolase